MNTNSFHSTSWTTSSLSRPFTSPSPDILYFSGSVSKRERSRSFRDNPAALPAVTHVNFAVCVSFRTNDWSHRNYFCNMMWFHRADFNIFDLPFFLPFSSDIRSIHSGYRAKAASNCARLMLSTNSCLAAPCGDIWDSEPKARMNRAKMWYI